MKVPAPRSEPNMTTEKAHINNTLKKLLLLDWPNGYHFTLSPTGHRLLCSKLSAHILGF